MAWTTSQIPDLTGKVVVITGANSGLGYESTKALSRTGAHVVMATRNVERGFAARDRIMNDDPTASLEVVELDLASIASLKRGAASILEAHPKIDILINNAGLMALPQQRTEDGFEMQFGVNHLGHWVLTAKLLPGLLSAESARVVSVTSIARLIGKPVDPKNPHLEGRYDPWRAYGQSKLANYHFALGLQRAFDKHGVPATSNSAHPGLSRTNLQTRTVEEGGAGRSGPVSEWLAVKMGSDPAEGALPQLRAATDPSVLGGELFAPRYVSRGAPVRRPLVRNRSLDAAIDRLWDVSVTETSVWFDFDAAT
ncbi:MAG: oxidoreductase [Actinomycetia bacterium]|nr:oxidoreductase [Actinomycetes bacterium]